jgi:tRNA nucleotidyltransferase/poly(A) polymerase
MRAIRALAPSVTGAAGERQREELARILASDSAARGLRLLDALGLLEMLIPEVTRGRGIVQPGDYHHYDVFDHNIEAVAVADRLLGVKAPAGRAPRAMRDEFWTALGRFGLREYFAGSAGGQTRLVLTKLATLLHDISKPETMTRDETGRIHFLGHAEQGAKAGRAICRRFKLGNKETDFVSVLIEEHLRPPQLAQAGAPSDRAIFRFFRALDDAAPACLVLSLADAASAQGPRLTLSRWRAHLAYIGYVLERGTAQTVSLGGRHFVSGDTLIRALGIPPGPGVGRLLAAVDEAAAAGEVRDEEAAIELARTIRIDSMLAAAEEAGRE